jgi:hypothetical protein
VSTAQTEEIAMSRFTSRRLGRRAVSAGALLGLLVATVAAAPASASPTVTRVADIHFSRSQHYDANPDCDFLGGTEVQEGNGYLVIVDNGDWLNVTAHETFRITVIFDDPTLPNEYRQVTSEIHFRAQPDGDVIFHNSFHDFGPAAGIPTRRSGS